MSSSVILNWFGALVQGTGLGAIFVVALMIGMCLALDVFKLRPSGPKSMTVRNLEEAMGQRAQYLPATSPRGTSDQLKGSKPLA